MKPTILEEIFKAKRLRVEERKRSAGTPGLDASHYWNSSRPGLFHDAFRRRDTNIIAEIKRASPSKGPIASDVNVPRVADAYMRGGAKAISVLTEEDYFNGSLEDLSAVRRRTNLPILQKDFIFDEFQISEAAAAGADAILLIVAMLGDGELYRLWKTAYQARLAVLVEVHDLDELERTYALGDCVIGVNNRNLHTFEVSLDISRKLIRERPAGRSMIAESGIRSAEEVAELRALGFDGFLIGETLMRSPEPDSLLRELIGGQYKNTPPLVKICGITNQEDALHAVRSGADALGFNFYPKSPRHITPEAARGIVNSLSAAPRVEKVGVFVNESIENIKEIVDRAGLDTVQLHGAESPEFVATVRKAVRCAIIKAFRVSNDFQPEEVLNYNIDAVLLDAYSSEDYGGTGETFNWQVARQVAGIVSKTYLAGGLSPDNVADAVRAARPYAVDACSLLEGEKGKKDHQKVKAFIETVKNL